MTKEDEDIEGLGAVPPWVLRVVRDLAETKKGVGILESAMIALNMKVETFVTRAEYAERHGEVKTELDRLRTDRVDPLWEAHNKLAGEQVAQQRTANRSRWIFGTVITVIGLWVALHTGHFSISF